ncbi:MAG: PD-(D/E)XK nuclease family protein, partial [Bacteroidales bacterium]|nr:PD-(D/E)XK nuclease family protein [Bacteroidales bacterium]
MAENTTFLTRLAQLIASEYADQLRDLTVLFPNKRAGLFFKKALSQKLNKAAWLPRISTIEQAFAQWSKLEIADNLSVQFELLEIKAAQKPGEGFNMAEYAGLASQMAEDFNEIDQQLADAGAVFNYLNEAKALELWHPDGSALTDSERRYLSFYRLLEKDYYSLRKALEAKEMAYIGMASRQLAELDEDALAEKAGRGRFVFAGFNALTRAEETVIIKLLKLEKAEIFWDIDTYYFEENEFGKHEAGNYIRRFASRFPKAVKNFKSADLLTSEKEIIIHPVPGNATQAKALGQVLTNSQSDSKTAVVLADENLLIPVLNAIPKTVAHFNVTLGFPFTKTAAFQYLSAYFNIHLRQRKIQSDLGIYLKPLLQLTSHELNAYFLSSHELEQINNWQQNILQNSQRFVSKEELSETFKENIRLSNLFELLLQPIDSTSIKLLLSNTTLLVNTLSDWILDSNKSQKHTLVNQFITAGKLLHKIEELVKARPELLGFEDFGTLFHKLAIGLRVPFSGEPLQGLQIMGLLETRNLDFESLHILGVNEGTLPQEKSYQSLIPADIRKAFGLSSYPDRQAVYAYHFFRLLQKANTIHLYYNNEPGSFGSGEQSRFIQQIRYELVKLNPKISLREAAFALPSPSKRKDISISIPKNEQVMKQLFQKAETGLSPSSLATYIICPLQFYLSSVVGLQPNESFQEGIKYNELGTAVHNALESLYTPIIDKKLTEADIDKMIATSEEVLDKHFLELYPKGLADFGNSLLMKEVARQFVKNFLYHEKKSLTDISITIKGLEEKLSIELVAAGTSVKLKGTIDRIDEVNQSTRLIDYKTGTVDEKTLKLKTWEQLLFPQRSKALQLAIYRLLMIKSGQISSPDRLECGIINLQKPGKGLMVLSLPEEDESISPEENITRQLVGLLEELYDKETP